MKTKLILIIFGLYSQIASAQVQSECIVFSNLQNNYGSDVKHLALKRIYNQNSPFKDSIDIPQNYQDTIWSGLAAIFNLSTIPQRDSVFDNYCIHHTDPLTGYIHKLIEVQLSPTCSWIQNWQNLITTTGVAALDTLLTKYGFVVTYFSSFSNWAVLTTQQSINAWPLCDSVATFDGVLTCGPTQNFGESSKIMYEKVGSDQFFDFELAFGDCWAGCTGHHTYQFKVLQDCSVIFLGVVDNTIQGLALPQPTNCNITTGIRGQTEEKNYQIFPNPAKDFLNIDGTGTKSTDYKIFNALGQEISTGHFFNKLSIEISNYPKGLYSIILMDDNTLQIVRLKFIKN